MRVIRARYDDKQVVLPEQALGLPAGEVVLVFPDSDESQLESLSWLKAQERAFANAWDNDEDDVYDSL